MDDFDSLDTAAHNTESPSKKIEIYKNIVSRAQTDPIFRKTIDNEKFWDSNNKLSALLLDENKSNGLNIAIIGYTSQLVGTWDPFTTSSGLPGSEECAVYASQELVNQGHKVTLYMNPPTDSIWKSQFSNPQWLPESSWYVSSNKQTYDLVLMWRRFDPHTARQRTGVVFFWPHDSPHFSPSYPQFPKFDGICVLSEHHRKQLCIYPGFDKIPYTICGNGIVPEQFTHPISFKNPYSLGYFSNYSRGLDTLISIWPEIRKEFPEATLSICYGRETWNTMSEQQLQGLVSKIEEYSNQGITEHGKIGHLELADVMQNTSVWAYPCNTAAETYCITAIKCQAAGCIPVTTRIGALDETIHPEAPYIPIIQNDQDIQKYKELLLETLQRIRDGEPENITEERQKYINFSKSHIWSECVSKWITLYHKVISK